MIRDVIYSVLALIALSILLVAVIYIVNDSRAARRFDKN